MKSTNPMMHFISQIQTKIKNTTHSKDKIPNPIPIFRQIYDDMRSVQIHALMGMVILAGLTLVGCQGCGSGKVTPQNNNELDTIPKEKVVEAKEVDYNSDFYDDEEPQYLENGRDYIKKGIQVEISEEKSWVKKLTLPNGKVLISNENTPLINEIPDKLKLPGDDFAHEYYDLSKMDSNLKNKLFGKAARKNGYSIQKLVKAYSVIDLEIRGKYIIHSCELHLSILIQDEGAESPYESLIGNISKFTIYDIDGNLLSSIESLENGGRLEEVNEKKNLVLLCTNTFEENEVYSTPYPIVTVFEFKSGKKMYEINTLGSPNASCSLQTIAISSQLFMTPYSCEYIYNPKNDILYFYKWKNDDQNSKFAFNNDDKYIYFNNGTIKVSLEDSSSVKRMTLDNWNNYAKETINNYNPLIRE